MTSLTQGSTNASALSVMLPEETNSTTVEGHLQRIMGFLSGGVGLGLSKQKVSGSRI